MKKKTLDECLISLISPKYISWVLSALSGPSKEGMRAWLSPGHIRAEKPLDSFESLCIGIQ